MSEEIEKKNNSAKKTPVVPPISKFIHFGCWNNLNEPLETTTNLKKVVENIKQKILDDKYIGLIAVAGDNYYPYKKVLDDGSKQKTINILKLEQGFKLIKSLKKNNPLLEIDMIMGNHDYEKNTKKFIIKDKLQTQNKDEECVITRAEMAITQDNDIDLQFYKARIIENNTLVLMLDTSIYLHDNESKDYEKCMNAFRNKGESETIQDIIKEQNQFIDESVNNGIKNGVDKIVFIGHHPLIQYKSKGKDNKPTKLSTDISEIYPVLLAVNFPNIKYYYLCADYHSYQHGTVILKSPDKKNMVIEQYISGTGGTVLDPDLGNIIPPSESNNKEIVDYTLHENQHTWGYLVCETEPDKLKCTFVPVPKSTETTPVANVGGGGKSRKYKKNKRKSKKSTYKRRVSKSR